MKVTNVLTSCRLVNFKAIRTTGRLKLTPLTVFIGNNGSGKSSVVEGLRTLQVMVESGVDEAMQLWRGVEHAYNKAAPTILPDVEPVDNVVNWGMAFAVNGTSNGVKFQSTVELLPSSNRDAISAVREKCKFAKSPSATSFLNWERDYFQLPITRELGMTRHWQFLNIIPQQMMPPFPSKTTPGRVRLAENGQNIAEYLEEIRKLKPETYDAIMATLRFVVPYMREVRAQTASLVEKTLYLSLIEPGLTKNDRSASASRQEIPGWMMSTGTLRALAIIASLRHPEPPSLLVVEEIENSLDPRTLGLIMEEVRRAVRSGRTQVILTTHSAQLLESVLLEHLVLVQRDEAGEPTFKRPSEIADVQKWSAEFTPAQMFSRGLFRQLS